MLVVARIPVGRHNRFYREEARALLTIYLSADDLARVRMAPSPLWETVCSFGVLTNLNRHSVHAPWARRAQHLPRGADVSPLVAVYRTAAADLARCRTRQDRRGQLSSVVLPHPDGPMTATISPRGMLKSTPLKA